MRVAITGETSRRCYRINERSQTAVRAHWGQGVTSRAGASSPLFPNRLRFEDVKSARAPHALHRSGPSCREYLRVTDIAAVDLVDAPRHDVVPDTHRLIDFGSSAQWQSNLGQPFHARRANWRGATPMRRRQHPLSEQVFAPSLSTLR